MNVLDADRRQASEGQNLFLQQQVARQVTREMSEVISLLSKGLIRHSNVGQQFSIKTSSVFMSLDTLSSLPWMMDKEIQFVANARIRLPWTFNRTERTSLRVRLSSLLSLEDLLL